MPIHAAGKYTTRSTICVSDFFVSCYMPTLDALHQARGRPSSTTEARVLPVIQPNAGPGYASLPNTKNELQEIHNIVPPRSILSLTESIDLDLNGDCAIVENVMRNLPEASILRLACHSIQDPGNPLQSAFNFRGGQRLTVEHLMQRPLPHAYVAFLSACHTAANDVQRPDEAINFASAMLFAVPRCGTSMV